MVYVGESARTGFERGTEHEADYEKGAEDSHMFKHWQNEHENEEKPQFSMKILRRHRSAFVRQINEAVLIEMHCEQDQILNSKSEYNRCQIPRLSVKIGERDQNPENPKVKSPMTEEDIEDALQLRQNRKRDKSEQDVPYTGCGKNGLAETNLQPQSKRRKVRMRQPEVGMTEKRKKTETLCKPGKRQRCECLPAPSDIFRNKSCDDERGKISKFYPIFNAVRKPGVKIQKKGEFSEQNEVNKISSKPQQPDPTL